MSGPRDATGHVVHVWVVDTDQGSDHAGELYGLLDGQERQRAATMADPVRRDRFVVAHGAARRIVAGCLGIGARDLVWTRGPHGKPEPAGVSTRMRFNMSGCSRLTLVAASRPVRAEAPPRAVGVDVERLITDRQAARIAARFFPAAQARYVATAQAAGGSAARFATLWTRKEAYVKAFGGRLVEGFGMPARPAEYRLRAVPAPDGFRAAVALEGPALFRLLCHTWSPATGEQTSVPYTLTSKADMCQR